jgi:hypothetical protein
VARFIAQIRTPIGWSCVLQAPEGNPDIMEEIQI